jgi:hypothetical protein
MAVVVVVVEQAAALSLSHAGGSISSRGPAESAPTAELAELERTAPGPQVMAEAVEAEAVE